MKITIFLNFGNHVYYVNKLFQNIFILQIIFYENRYFIENLEDHVCLASKYNVLFYEIGSVCKTYSRFLYNNDYYRRCFLK